jgi:beta-lactamase regulating signal transducer with metallopeptidase domain
MNELAVRFMWLMGQVTLLTLAAAGLCATLTRRRPGAGAGVALAGLGGLVVLTLLALIPLPMWWSWIDLPHGAAAATRAATARDHESLAFHSAADLDREARTPPLQGVPTEGADAAAGGWSLAHLRQLWGRLVPAIGGAARQNPAWSSRAVLLLLAGVCFCLLRLLLALFAVHRCQTKSQSIDDFVLHTLLTTLRSQMGCGQAVEVREAADLGGPVTVGWRHPVVLLPPQWRQWSSEELRAVLAHELAHVSRLDYAAWLVARFSVALHFYHPLAHWLASRLHLQQELAADALGAMHSGGRQAYLRALARLALRQEESLCTGPARAFLPARGTLMRRIAMLQIKEEGPGRRWPGPLALVLVGLAVAGVSALRGPARASDKPQGSNLEPKVAYRAAQAPSQLGNLPATAERPPFAYCYCSPEAAGFFAFRPSVCFGSDQRMKKLAGEIDQGLTETMKAIGGPESFPKIEEIEQVSGCIFLKINEKAPKGQRGMLLSSLLTVRTIGEYDWKKALHGIASKVSEVPFAGHTYYKVAVSDFKSPALLGLVAERATANASHEEMCICFFLPDKRTLAMGSEQQFKELLRNGMTAKPAWAMAAGWERVEHGIFAAAITNQGQRFTKEWLKSPPEEVPSDVNAAVAKATALVLGLDYNGELHGDLFGLCANDDDAISLANTLLHWTGKGLRMVQLDRKKNSSGQVDLQMFSGKKLHIGVGLERGSGDNQQVIVHAQGHAKMNFAELFDLTSGAKIEAVEVKDK